jgi:ABC-2 type transport system ATP-binding protein
VSVEVVSLKNVNKTFTIKKQKSLKDRLVGGRKGKLQDETFAAVEDLSLSISLGESVGLVGPNGSGKSTLLKIIGGILAADTGSVQTRGRIAALLELGAGFHPDLSGRENVFLNASMLGLTRAETLSHFSDIVEFSGIDEFIDTQVKFYSSGMYVRLAFSVAVHVDPDILLVDEVLAVGDVPFQTKCMQKIRQFRDDGRTIILVSHSPGQVADVCDRAIVLERGRLVEDSTPMVALGRLRRDYQQVMAAEAVEDTSRVSSHRGEITRTYLTDSLSSRHDADFQVVMPPGSDLHVHCEVTFPEPVPDWSLNVSIESTHLGTSVIEADTNETLGWNLPSQPGTLPFIFTFPNLQLGEGDYCVRLILRDEEGIALDRLPQAGYFAVRGPRHVIGPVYSEPRIDYPADA